MTYQPVSKCLEVYQLFLFSTQVSATLSMRRSVDKLERQPHYLRYYFIDFDYLIATGFYFFYLLFLYFFQHFYLLFVALSIVSSAQHSAYQMYEYAHSLKHECKVCGNSAGKHSGTMSVK